MTSRASLLVVGAYAWLVAVCFGATLIDVAYASVVPEDQADVRDLLLVIWAMAIMTGTGAVAVAWGWGAARPVLLVSLVLVAAEVLTPLVLSGFMSDTESALDVRIGPWIRLGVSGAASVVAAVGVWASWRADRPGPRV